MNKRLFVWWLCFLSFGMVCQMLLPGVDALVIGAILALQEKNYKELAYILPVLIVLQEGMGTREFGGMVLWYCAVMLFFIIGRWLFEVQNTLFVFLIAFGLGAARFAMAYILAPLQGLSLDMIQLLYDSVWQAAFIPPTWWLAAYTRRWTRVDADNA